MELRRCSHLHSISVIQGEEVMKVMNITRRKKQLKFKTIKEIYASHNSLLKYPLKAGSSVTTSGSCNKVKPRVKIEPVEESALEDDNLTLKELQDACRCKKRKASASVDLRAIKTEISEWLSEENETEFTETLHSLKRKLLKIAKPKEGSTICSSMPSKANNFHCALRDFPNDLSDRSKDPEKSGNSFAEDGEPDHLHVPAMTDRFLSNGVGNETRSTAIDADPLFLDPGDVSHFQIHEPPSFELNEASCLSTSHHSSNHHGYDLLQNAPTCEDFLDPGISMTNSNPEYDGHLEPYFMEPIPISVEFPCDHLSEVSHEHLNTLQLQNLCMTELSRAATVCQTLSVSPTSERSKLEDVSNWMIIPSTEKLSDELLWTSWSNSQNVKLINLGVESKYTDDDNDVEASVSGRRYANKVTEVEVCGRSVESYYSTSANDFDLCDTIFEVEDDNLSMLDKTNALLICSPDIQTLDAVNKGIRSAGTSNDEKAPHPCKALFSERKMISPTSQEKLLRAMNSVDQQDEGEAQTCREKLFRENGMLASRSNGREQVICSTKRPVVVDATNVAVKPRRKMRHKRTGRRRSFLKGLSKQATSGLSPDQQLLQNAIDFSQQQMQDFVPLTQVLLTELQNMKEVVKNTVAQARMGEKQKINKNEALIAIKKVNKVGLMTQKYISLWSKDCTRFCKIMTLARADLASPEIPVLKRSKKVTFADEAGGELCEIKVIEASMTDADIGSPI